MLKLTKKQNLGNMELQLLLVGYGRCCPYTVQYSTPLNVFGSLHGATSLWMVTGTRDKGQGCILSDSCPPQQN
jgi:hypothetical protein